MRTILYGQASAKVIREAVEAAALFAGIHPTSIVVNDRLTPPAALGLPVDCYPVCKKAGESAVRGRNYTLAQNADALIALDDCDDTLHLIRVCRLPGYELPIHMHGFTLPVEVPHPLLKPEPVKKADPVAEIDLFAAPVEEVNLFA